MSRDVIQMLYMALGFYENNGIESKTSEAKFVIDVEVSSYHYYKPFHQHSKWLLVGMRTSFLFLELTSTDRCSSHY